MKTSLNINDLKVYFLMIAFIIYCMNICPSVCTNAYVYDYVYAYIKLEFIFCIKKGSV